jgi:chromosome partitioning protein
MGLNIMPSDLGRTLFDVLRPNHGLQARLDDILLNIRDNFDLAPSSAKLSVVEQELAGVDARESRLHNAIRSLEESYDFVIIDCPPSIGHLSFNALRASQECIIPIDLSLFSLRGVSKLTELIYMLKENMDHDMVSRALITMYDYRTRYAKHVLEKVQEEFGENVYETVIRYNIRLREAVDYGMPIGEYDKRSIGHMDYEKLAEEVLRSDTSGRDSFFDTVNAAEGIIKRDEGRFDYAEEESDGMMEGENEPYSYGSLG